MSNPMVPLSANAIPAESSANASEPPIASQPNPARNLNEIAHDDRGEGAQQTSEYWVVFGHHLKITDSLVATFTFVLVLVGAVQGYWLWRTVSATEIAADSARRVAEALPKLERAYVFLSHCVCDDIASGLRAGPNGIAQCKVHYGFKNHGRTPAILERHYVSVAFVEKGFPEREPLFDLPGNVIMSAGQERKDSELDGKLVATDYGRARRGDGRLCFWGALGYRDVFGEPHETGFCSEWNFREGRFVVSKTDELNYHT
jgi:hypothetical protein